MYGKTNWPEKFNPKISAIYALNDIDVKAPPRVVWKHLIEATNWHSYFPPEDQVKIHIPLHSTYYTPTDYPKAQKAMSPHPSEACC